MAVVNIITGIYDNVGNDIFNEVQVVNEPELTKNNNIYRGNDGANIVRIITPISTEYVRDITFMLNSGRSIDYRSFQTFGTIDVIYQGLEQTWNYYNYSMTSDILSDTSLLKSSPLYYTARFREQDPLYYGAFDTSGELPLIATDPTLVEGNFATVGTTTFTTYEYDATLDQWDDLGFLKNQYIQTVNCGSLIDSQLTVYPTVQGGTTTISTSEVDLLKNAINDINDELDQIESEHKQQDVDGNFEPTNDEAWSSDKRMHNYLIGEYKTLGLDYTFGDTIHTEIDLNEGGVGGKNTWSNEEQAIETIINANVTLQNGRELLKLGRNTGAPIPDLEPLAVIGSVGQTAEVEPVDITNPSQSFKTIGMATELIGTNETKNMATVGRVRGDFTGFTEGADLYCAIGGGLTETKPSPPNRCIRMGTLERTGTTGIFYLNPIILPNVSELSDVELTSIQDNESLVYETNKWVNKNLGTLYASKDIQNGQFKESIIFTYDNVTKQFVLDKDPNDSTYATSPTTLTMQFSDGDTTLTVPTSIAPTFGSTNALQDNWFYIPKSTKVLTKSTSFGIKWDSTEEHIRVAFTSLLSQAITDTEGSFILQVWNNHEKGTNDRGKLQHIQDWIRGNQARYDSGVDTNGNNDYLDDSTTSGTYYWKSSAGIVWQMHPQDFMSHDTESGDDIHVLNDPDGAYNKITTINEITKYSDGTSIGNQYYSIVVWGVANKSGQYAPLLATTSTGGYTNVDDATNDVDSKAVTTLPRKFTKDSSTAFPIARLVMQKSGASINYITYKDLRNTGLGGGASAGDQDTSFLDSDFEIVDTDNANKKIKFDAGQQTTNPIVTLGVKDKASYIVADDAELQEVRNEVLTADTQEYPYNEAQGNLSIPKNGVPIAINEPNSLPIADYQGQTLEQIVSNGDATQTYEVTVLTAEIDIDTNGLWVASTGYDATKQTYNGNIGDKFLFISKWTSSVGANFEDRVLVRYADSTFETFGSAGVEANGQTIQLITLSKSGLFNTKLKHFTSSIGDVEKVYQMLIPLPSNLTLASEVEALLDGTYFEGINYVNNPIITTYGKNKFNGEIELGVYKQSDGTKDDTILTAIRSVGASKVLPSTLYQLHDNNAYTYKIFEYDKDDNYLGYTDNVNAITTTATTAYIRFNAFNAGNDDLTTLIQLEIGSVATTYEEYITNTLTVQGELQGIGGVYDDLKTQRFDRDFNNVVQSATSWSIQPESGTQVVTHAFGKDLSSLLDYKNAPNSTTLTNVVLKIGTMIFPNVTDSIIFGNDTESFTIKTDGTLAIRVNKTTYPNSASFEAYLQANDVEFIYELDTYLPRNETNNNIIPLLGECLTGENYTYEQSSSGVIGEFDLASAINFKGQVKLLEQTNVKQSKEIVRLDSEIDAVNVRVDSNEENITINSQGITDNANNIATLTRTTLFSGTQLISTTTQAGANLTLSEAFTNFEHIVFELWDASSTFYYSTQMIPTKSSTINVDPEIQISKSSTQNQKFTFNIEAVTTTTLKVHEAELITTLYGTSPQITRATQTGYDIKAVYGYKN